jgi:hypothetical protein
MKADCTPLTDPAQGPLAHMRDPISLDDHQSSRWISEPLHLLDCCLVSNGGIAVIVTSAERAATLAQPPVCLLGWAQAHPGRSRETFGLVSGAATAGPAALAMAGVGIADRGFFDGTARGQFVLRRCTDCGELAEPELQRCPNCESQQLGWQPAAGGARPRTSPAPAGTSAPARSWSTGVT